MRFVFKIVPRGFEFHWVRPDGPQSTKIRFLDSEFNIYMMGVARRYRQHKRTVMDIYGYYPLARLETPDLGKD